MTERAVRRAVTCAAVYLVGSILGWLGVALFAHWMLH